MNFEKTSENPIVNHEEIEKDFGYLKNKDENLYNKITELIDKIVSAPDNSCLRGFHIQHGLQWQHICGAVAEMRAFADVASDYLKQKSGEGQNDALKIFENISEAFKDFQKAYDTWFEQGAPEEGEPWSNFCDASNKAFESFKILSFELGKS